MRMPYFKFWCQKVLPAVYDDSLSYYELLCKVVDELNKVITKVNETDDEIYNYINMRFDNLQSEWITILQANLKEYKALTDLRIEQNEIWTKQKIAELESTLSMQLEQIAQMVRSNNVAIKTFVYFEIAKLRKEVEKITCVVVESPVTGNQMPIQQALNEMYNALRCCALTAIEYDSLQLSAQDYDNFELTAKDYDLYGKSLLSYLMPCFMMYSPFNGKYENIREVTYQLADLHKTTALSATEYDVLDLTANTYDGKSLTAYVYDWQGIV